ncbi:MAG: chloride channel protein [Chthoniobacterales bacterium]
MALRAQLRFLFVTVCIGLASGLAAVAFQMSADWITTHLLLAKVGGSFWGFALTSFPIMIGGALIAGILMHRYAPEASGSGIPQVKAAYHQNKTIFSWNVLWVKFVGGVLSIGTGSSLGREGPTVHIGAALASRFAVWSGESEAARGNAICAGSAAGLAAAFNSPLAGVTLVLEEIAGGKNEDKFAGRALLAAALAVLVVYLLMGDRAAFPISLQYPMHGPVLWLAPVIAIVAGILGLVFQRMALGLRAWIRNAPIAPWARPAAGAAIGCIAALAAFKITGSTGVFGLGEQQIISALNQEVFWRMAGYLALAKLISTIFCYGSGGCGGIFAPILFFGGMSGLFISGCFQDLCGLTAVDMTLLTIVGMTACLAAVVRAPLTSILIVFEMTREVSVLPALMIAAVIGVFMNRICFKSNFYDEALAQDGIRLE